MLPVVWRVAAKKALPDVARKDFICIFARQIVNTKQQEEAPMARFINPFTDVGFKRIFGQE